MRKRSPFPKIPDDCIPQMVYITPIKDMNRDTRRIFIRNLKKVPTTVVCPGCRNRMIYIPSKDDQDVYFCVWCHHRLHKDMYALLLSRGNA